MKDLKHIALAACLVVSALSSKAQSGYFVSASNGTTADTVVNTAAKTQTLGIAGYQDVISLQVALTTISGTPAGVVRIYGADIPGKFVRIPTLNATTYAAGLDSLNVNVNALSKIFIVPAHSYAQYRVIFTGSGTQSTVLQTYGLARKR